MKNLPNPVRGTEEENQLDQSIKNFLTLTRDRDEKPTDFQKESLSLFRPFIRVVLSLPASFLFGGPV